MSTACFRFVRFRFFFLLIHFGTEYKNITNARRHHIDSEKVRERALNGS